MTWIPVSEALPEYDDSVLVWVRFVDDTGEVQIARFREERLVHPDDPNADSFRTVDPHFCWSGGDNDRKWCQSLNWRGFGGYGYEESGDRVTHWMPLPEAP